jgi:hypothetical protein
LLTEHADSFQSFGMHQTSVNITLNHPLIKADRGIEMGGLGVDFFPENVVALYVFVIAHVSL